MRNNQKKVDSNEEAILAKENFLKNIDFNGMDSNSYGVNMNPHQTIQSVQYDSLPLPSEGKFYKRDKDGNVIDRVDVSYLTLEDESILTSENLLRSGRMLDELLKAKVRMPAGLTIDDLLLGDKIAILVWLRATMEPVYKVNLINPKDGKEFTYDFDLNTLQLKDISEQPDQNGEFSFFLKRSKKMVKFRLMTGFDEKEINMQDIREQKINNGQSQSKVLTLMRQITYIDGIYSIENKNSFEKERFIRKMPLLDSRELYHFMNSVMPSFDLNVEIPTPDGGSFRTFLPFTAEFFYPTL